jgi:hypothetical protein
MRLRLLAFLPPAALITAALLVSASSFVSAIETSFVPEPIMAVEVQRFESDCEVLHRRILEISWSATNCHADLQCLGSPILCPITMDRDKELEYRNLRSEFDARCGLSSGLNPPSGPAGHERSGSHPIFATCGSTFDWPLPEASGRSSLPGTFIF